VIRGLKMPDPEGPCWCGQCGGWDKHLPEKFAIIYWTVSDEHSVRPSREWMICYEGITNFAEAREVSEDEFTDDRKILQDAGFVSAVGVPNFIAKISLEIPLALGGV